MARVRWAIGACALSACGRIDFDPLADAGDRADTATQAGFCASLTRPVYFCDDFDTPGEAYGARWSRITTENTGSQGYTEAFASSPPRSARHEYTTDDGNTVSKAHLELDLPGITSRVTLGFDLYSPARVSSGNLFISGMGFDAAGIGFHWGQLRQSADNTDAFYEESFPAAGGFFYGDALLPKPLAIGAWQRIEITNDMTTDTFVLEIDGATAVQGPLDYTGDPGVTNVASGLQYIPGLQPGAIIYIDNVVIEKSP